MIIRRLEALVGSKIDTARFKNGQRIRSFKDGHKNLPAKQYRKAANNKFKAIHFKQFPIENNLFVLASDGLWDNLNHELALRILNHPSCKDSPDQAARTLKANALSHNKKPDDITIIAGQFDSAVR